MPWWPFWEGDPLKWYECIGWCIAAGLFGYLTAVKFVEWYLIRTDLNRHKLK